MSASTPKLTQETLRLQITRPQPLSARFTEVLATHGIDWQMLPAIRIKLTPLELMQQQLQMISDYDIVIVQSRFAVLALEACLTQHTTSLSIPTSTKPAIKKMPQWIAIGAATAQQLQHTAIIKTLAGGACSAPKVLVPRQESSEGLLAMPELAYVKGLRILLCGAVGGRKLLQQTLLKRDACVQALACYTQELPAPAVVEAIRHTLHQARTQDVWLLSSCRSLDNIIAICSAAERAMFRRATLLATSDRIKRYALEQGCLKVLLAAAANAEAVVSVLKNSS